MNLPVDTFRSQDFIDFNPQKIIDEVAETDEEKKMIKNRKRSMVFIVAHRLSATGIFDHLHDLFDKDTQTQFKAEDILATKNSILLYRALKLEKTREVYLCRNSFNVIEDKYPFMCKFGGCNLYIEPKKTNGYPNEILDRRLYLGDKTHAENEAIIHNLGITHILNVSHNIPNTFEESKTMNVKYQRINIQDRKEVPIDLSFDLAYEFIEDALSTKKRSNTRMLKTKFDVVQNFTDSRKKSASLISSAVAIHEIILDLSNKSVENVQNALNDKLLAIDSACQIQSQKSNNQNRVLVHCAMGMSRSATMVIMYLMRKFEIDINMSLNIVKTRREIIDPNEGFIEKLQMYEGKQYKLKRTITAKDQEKVEEVDELSEFSQAEDSSSEEDLMISSKSILIGL